MKQIFTLLFSILTTLSFAQNFAHPGAEWKYSYHSVMGAIGYAQISVAGDTLIGNITATKLEKRLVGVDQVSQQPIDQLRNPDYVYENAGIVFIRHGAQWDTLFNYNAQVGDSWTIAKQPLMNNCNNNSSITVTGVGTRNINGMNLSYKLVDITYFSGINTYTLADTLYQRIGLVKSYMLSFDNCDAELDVNEGGDFRCYLDNEFDLYKASTFTEDCQYIMSNSSTIKEQVRFYPNPATTSLKIDGNIHNLNYSVANLQGQEVLSGIYTNEIKIDQLNEGIYILSIHTSQGVINHRFVKK